MGRQSLFEVAHNGAFFAHLASTLWIYRTLDGTRHDAQDGLRFHWADLASEHAEPVAGGDFAFIVPLGGDRCKLAIAQAKRESDGAQGFASIWRQVGEAGKQQLDILLDHEARTPIPGSRHGVVGSWCFYVFWHRLGAGSLHLPPIVRSAWDISERARKKRLSLPDRASRYDVSTTDGGTDLASFLAHDLPDPRSRVGLDCHRLDLAGLLGVPLIRPRTIVLLNLPGTSWPLGYWTELLSALPDYTKTGGPFHPAPETKPVVPATGAPAPQSP